LKRLFLFVLLLSAVACVPVASAFGPALAVKSGGQWYWSPDLAEGIYAPNSLAETPLRHIGSSRLLKGLDNLTVDQKRSLKSAVAGAITEGTWRPDFKDGTVVHSWHCRGAGASIASARIDVDLYHRFACTMRGAKYGRVGQFTEAIEDVRAQIRATPAPVPQALLNKLVRAYYALSTYRTHGDSVTRTIPVFVTGRRAVALVGVDPI
jgi:hypothetical protein